MSREGDVLRGWLAMLEVTEHVKKRLDTRLREAFGVSLAGFDILAALHAAGGDGLRAGDLAKRLRVSDGATSQVAATLEKAGLIVREKAVTDRRVVVMSITPAGDAQFTAMARAHHGWLGHAFKGLSDKDIERLSALAAAIDPLSADDRKATETA
mgnify:CR=1 FL=1